MDNYTEDIDFTVLFDDDTIESNKSKNGGEHTMVMFTYVNTKTAKDIFEYYAMIKLRPNKVYGRNFQNPIQLPITLYEYADIAKALAPNGNNVLIKLYINTGIQQIYDEFNPFSTVKENDINIFLIRKKCKYKANREYISYIIKNIDIIQDIQILE